MTTPKQKAATEAEHQRLVTSIRTTEATGWSLDIAGGLYTGICVWQRGLPVEFSTFGPTRKDATVADKVLVMETELCKIIRCWDVPVLAVAESGIRSRGTYAIQAQAAMRGIFASFAARHGIPYPQAVGLTWVKALSPSGVKMFTGHGKADKDLMIEQAQNLLKITPLAGSVVGEHEADAIAVGNRAGYSRVALPPLFETVRGKKVRVQK